MIPGGPPPVRRPPDRPAAAPAGPGLRIRKPHSRIWQATLAALGALVVLTVCGLSGYFIMIDEQAGTGAQANGATPAVTAVPRDITSREADPAPLTEAEIFPSNKQIVIATDQPPYQVLRTQIGTDCKVAATEELAKKLAEAGCNQVVRGTMKSPNGQYLVTGGIFNLASQTAAEQLHEAVKPLVDGKKGRFTGLSAGAGTDPIVLSSTHLGWDVRGHFLIYCVIARADGKEFAQGDPYAKQIIFDIVELHLRNNVLEKRAFESVGGAASPSASASAAGG
jgi:hypothetical protein